MENKEGYETPELMELGAMEELTREHGWGWQEFFASIVSGGPISVGHCHGSCFS